MGGGQIAAGHEVMRRRMTLSQVHSLRTEGTWSEPWCPPEKVEVRGAPLVVDTFGTTHTSPHAGWAQLGSAPPFVT